VSSRQRVIWKRRIWLVAWNVLLTVALVAVADLGITYVAHWRQARLRSANDYIQKSETLHHALIPRKSAPQASFGPLQYAVYVNSLGMRDATPREVPLRSPRRRILLLGDSFTEGVGLPYESTFAGILAERLAERDVEVLNGGVQSYAPVLHLRALRHWIEELGLEVDEITCFLDLSDPEDEIRYAEEEGRASTSLERPWSPNPQVIRSITLRRLLRPIEPYIQDLIPALDDGFDWIKQNTTLIRLAGYWIRRLNFGESLALGLNMRRATWTSDEAALAAMRPGLELAGIHMSDLLGLARRHDIPLSIVVYPWPDQIYRRERGSVYESFWDTWARENGVSFYTLFPDFVTDGDPAQMIRDHFIPEDAHWNSKGHLLVAERFLQMRRGSSGD
jgi:lysophospholipase L1-like esterase